MDILLKFNSVAHISLVHLMACEETLCLIAKVTLINPIIENIKNLYFLIETTLKMQFLNLSHGNWWILAPKNRQQS
jgi:hypothetical protein